jgi:Na+/H+ antiporter NhaD/arsenite permease-like protein
MSGAADVETYRVVAAAVTLILLFLSLIFTRLHRAVLGLLAASIVLVLHLAPYERLTQHIDVNVIMLIVSMMIVVAVMRRTGLFQYMAVKSAKLSGGDPLRLLILLAIVTAVLSAFFDNVTTVLLMSPITLVVCAEFRTSPIPFLVTQALASNFGGTATLVGDPPNIMIGSAANLSFNQFILHLSPLVIIVMAVYAIFLRARYRRKVGYASAVARARLATMDERKSITDKKLLVRGLVVLAFVLVGFLLHNVLSLEAGVVALCGAVALLVFSRADIAKVLAELEWTTPIFFICLYIVVGAAVEVGLIRRMGEFLFGHASGNLFISAMLIMWFSAILSAFVSSVPFTAMMIPVVREFIFTNNIQAGGPFWWALAIGACFGANLTLIGAAANVVTAGIAEKAGYRITFKSFFREGAPVTVTALVISSIYLYLRYFA